MNLQSVPRPELALWMPIDIRKPLRPVREEGWQNHSPTYTSPNLPSPWWSIIVMLFSDTLSHLSGDSMALHVESLSPALLSGQDQLHFLWSYQPLCFQNCSLAACGVELTPPSLDPHGWKWWEKQWTQKGVRFRILPAYLDLKDWCWPF